MVLCFISISIELAKFYLGIFHHQEIHLFESSQKLFIFVICACKRYSVAAALD